MTSMEFQQIRDRLVLAALPHATFEGWSPKALAEAARDEGMDPSLAERAFLGGPVEAVEHFSRLADRLMLADLMDLDLESMRVTDRVFTAMRARLSRWSHQREAIRRAFSLLALPVNTPAAARATFATVDAIWHAAGDSSHDFSWYTRRATLAAVYSATVLYWLEDQSEDCADTWDFLRRRLADVGRVTKARKRVETWLEKLPQPGRLMPPLLRR